jgi:hypothetical protein
MNWLDELVSIHSEYEAPLSFWKWSGIASISAVVKDNIWLPRFIYDLYPNIYVMFHADSGLKKGPPVSMAHKLVDAVNNTYIISGRSSVQGILKEMGTAKTEPGGKIASARTVFICSSELTSSIVEDKVAMDILTDLYDRQYRVGHWRSLLKMETFDIKNPTVTMLGATNEAHSNEYFTKKDVQGGYFARTFIIYERERNRKNSLAVPPKVIPDYKQFSEHLKRLAQLKGKFQLIGSREQNDIWPLARKDSITGETFYYTEAGHIYEEWYDEHISAMDAQTVKDDTGTMNRFGDSVLKVAMLLALSKKAELIIDPESMKEAILICEKLIGSIRHTTMGHGMALNSPLKTLIMMELLEREPHQISRAMLMKKMWMHYSSATEFDEMMAGFDQSGMIKAESRSNQIIFTMPEQQVLELKKYFAGKIR